MNDVPDLLARAAEPVRVDDATVDADLARGRRALRRLRIAQAGGSAVALAAVGMLALGGASLLDRTVDPPPQASDTGVDDGATTDPQQGPAEVDAEDVGAPEPDRASAPPELDGEGPEPGAVTLVTFDGEQPSGYEVELIPDGWEIQLAAPSGLLIAPVGAVDQDRSSFLGKLLIMTRSLDDQGTPHGQPIPMGDDTAYLNPQPEASILTYLDAGGTWVQVQVPPELNWTPDDIVEFASGVTVTAHVEDTYG